MGKVAHKVGYLITYSSVVCQSLFLGFGVFRQSWRIVKSVMLNFCSTGKIRAIFRRVSAERNDQIKIDGKSRRLLGRYVEIIIPFSAIACTAK